MGVKLKHASGNGTVIGAPAANPSADITLKAPSTTGSAGQVLKVATANHSSTNAELEWAADSGGKILQVVSANSDTNTQFTNQTSYADHTNHTISITPTEAGSKIVLLAQFRFTVIKNHVETNSKWRLVLTIGSGSATYPLGADMNQTIEAGKSTNNRTSITVQVPVNYTTGATSNTTDAYVFKIQGKNNSSSDDSESQAKYWRAIAMEVAA